MKASQHILLEALENRQFLSADFAGFAPPDEQHSAGAITIADVDVAQKLTGSWTGEIVGKEGLIATVQINIKSVEPDGLVMGGLNLTLYPKDETMTIAVTGQFDADKNALALEWNADKTCFGTLTATFDPVAGQLDAQIDYNMAGEQCGYSFMLEKMPVWENFAKPGPCIVPSFDAVAGTWFGQIFDKEGLIASLALNIKDVAPTGEFLGTMTYQPRKGEVILVDVTGQFVPEKFLFTLSWNKDKEFFGTMSGTMSADTRTIEAGVDYSDASGRYNYFVTLEKLPPTIEHSLEAIPNDVL